MTIFVWQHLIWNHLTTFEDGVWFPVSASKDLILDESQSVGADPLWSIIASLLGGEVELELDSLAPIVGNQWFFFLGTKQKTVCLLSRSFILVPNPSSDDWFTWQLGFGEKCPESTEYRCGIWVVTSGWVKYHQIKFANVWCFAVLCFLRKNLADPMTWSASLQRLWSLAWSLSFWERGYVLGMFELEGPGAPSSNQPPLGADLTKLQISRKRESLPMSTCVNLVLLRKCSKKVGNV